MIVPYEQEKGNNCFSDFNFCISSLYYLASKKSDNMGNNDKIGVVVSLGPQVEFVKAVGGDKVDVTLMVPSNADPHTYEPLANQLSRFQMPKCMQN